MNIWIPCNPPTRTHQAKQLRIVHGKPMLYKNKAQKEIEASVAALLQPHQPQRPIDGPYRVQIELVFPPTKQQTSTKAKRDHLDSGGTIPHVAKPDLDNFSKGFVDELVRLRFIHDDRQIVELSLKKCVGHDAGIRVNIEGVALARK